MDNSMKDAKKRFMDYTHTNFKSVLFGIILVPGGIVGLKVSIWLAEWWTNILEGYSGRMNLIVFILPYILPIIMGIVILSGATWILSFPLDIAAKSKHAKLLKTEEGEKLLFDFDLAAHYFEDKLRIGKLYIYKRKLYIYKEQFDFYPFDKIELFKLEKKGNFYPFDKIELFKLEKKGKKISLFYKIKGKKEKELLSFDKYSWSKSKNDIMTFFAKMEIEHPKITLEIL